MRSLDLSATSLQSKDLTYFLKEISDPQANITLESLYLSDNQTVNDEVIKSVCILLKTNTTVKHLYLDKTKVTVHGLRLILKAIEESRSVETISIKDCNMSLMGVVGDEIIELLKNNFSLTNLHIEHNNFDTKFKEGKEAQLELNKNIIKYVFT